MRYPTFLLALKSRTELLGRDDPVTAQASRSMGIVKYMLKSYAEARIYLSDFIRVMDVVKNVETIDYIIALQVLGELHEAEGRVDDARKSWTLAQAILQRSSNSSKKLPELEELISLRLESAKKAPKEKGFFSRITELTRLDDEVAPGSLSVGQQVDKMLKTYVFIDD